MSKTTELLFEAMCRIVAENGGEFSYDTVCGMVKNIHYTHPKKE